ncbi:MAG TPA: hypothetical protein VKA01_15825 [Vicinamibacteria bacterium]|nr:hypothetical protein [Vicinamibacteria bacterium]
MRLRLLLSLAALLAAADNADAGVFKKRGGLPTPISLTDERVERSAGATKPLVQKHPPPNYAGPDWGSRFDQIKYNYPPRPLTPRLRRLEY